MKVSYTGANHDVELATVDVPVQEEIRVEGPAADWIAHIDENLAPEKNAEGLSFRLLGTKDGGDMVFVPHYCQHTERFGVYWRIVGEA